MRYLLAIAILFAPSLAWANCTTHTYTGPDGRTIFCTTCCYGTNCTTYCN